MTKVWIVNDHSHDFSPAKKFGELVSITEDRVNPLQHHKLFLSIAKKISQASPDDFLLLCGHQALNVYCSLAWILWHKKMRLLIYDSYHNRYLVRDFSLWDIFKKLTKLGLNKFNPFEDIEDEQQTETTRND